VEEDCLFIGSYSLHYSAVASNSSLGKWDTVHF